ncbi:uncharacterized protein LOC126828597 isoform X3 [Patella vulgata]|uniref:uncharacterized protein LOC126828597 isoform X3 n=1 Tax=Patella vulgata TaxID=6465 RepID=UPI00217FC6AA|nr:uncharacterized protein LOC126828597 isoform X3 [Patella vulgata]
MLCECPNNAGLAGKRRHVETERMREFRAVGEETRIRRRKCPHEGCNKWFTSNPGLKYHVNTHSPTKSSYKCQNCFRSFISFNGLKYHKKSICKRQSISPKHNPDPEPTVKKKTGPEPARPKRSPPQRPEVKPNRPICRFDDDNRLRDLAIIATGPQSPLLQKTSVTAALNTGSENVKRALDLSCKPKKLPEATTSYSMPLSATDSTAVIALSSMQQKKYQEQKSGNSAPNSPNLPDSPKAKRPMNGFMLFAKEKRVEYTRKHPGKDNRAISKLLGEEWKALDIKDKEYYKEEAKQLSKQQVKLHPDCWKRKR